MQPDGFKPEQFEVLYALEAGSFWFRARNALILWALTRYFPAAGSMLEIGCGTGYVLAGVAADRPAMKLVGSELFAEGAAFAARRVRSAEIIQMDATDMPFKGEFDVIGAFDVLEHVEHDLAALRQVHTSLLPGGGLLITVPQHPTMWSAADDFAHHKRRYSRKELLGKVREAGFRVLRCTSFVTLLQPAMLVSRLLQRDDSTYDPMAEFRIGQVTNRLLGGVMGFERALIRAGANLPFGGSLLLVGVKQ